MTRKTSSARKKYLAPDPILHEYMEGRLNHSKYELDASARKVVREAIEGYCSFKGWPLLALNVRTNHVHVVVSAVEGASKMLNAIKARATRMLRESGAVSNEQPVWTERGNKGHLLTPEAVSNAIAYVLDQQGPDI